MIVSKVIGSIHTLFSLFYSLDIRQTSQEVTTYQVGSKLSMLALALTYTCTRGSLLMLQAFFGLTATPLVMWMHYGKQIIIKILQNLDDIHIKMPTTNHLFEYANTSSVPTQFCPGIMQYVMG
jgi:hypothetical protein